MMIWANVTEQDLYKEKEIETSFGETLSWEYLCYVNIEYSKSIKVE